MVILTFFLSSNTENDNYQIGFFIEPGPYKGRGDFAVRNKDDFGTGNLDSIPLKTFYLIMGRIFIDKNKKEEFINYVVKGDLLNIKNPVNLKNKFVNIVDDLTKIYEKEIKAEEKIYDKLRKTPTYKDLTEGIDDKMYVPKKTRKFIYTTVPNTDQTIVKYQTDSISNLYKSVNADNDDTTFLGKIKFSKT